MKVFIVGHLEGLRGIGIYAGRLNLPMSPRQRCEDCHTKSRMSFAQGEGHALSGKPTGGSRNAAMSKATCATADVFVR